MQSLLEKELPGIVSNGAFGKSLKYVSFEINNNKVGQDQYMSTVIFGIVNTSEEIKYNVLIKLKLRNEKLRAMLKIDFQFHNEITMYETIIPHLFQCHRSIAGVGDWPTLARFFYGRNKCGEFALSDLIVLENLEPMGYQLSEAHPFIDFDHLVCALRSLAKFHGLSYTAKHKDPDCFQKIITYLHDTQFDVNGKCILQKNMLNRLGKRGVDRLLGRSGGDLYRDNEHLRRFNELIGDGVNSLRRALDAREPWSIVCHGDFNRNNVLFRYDGAGIPVDVLLFDFGISRYGSPALDISFFLYMNTTQNMRESRWDDLMNEYCSALAKSVPPVVRVPNRDELDSEMAMCAFFGFAHASHFLPRQLEHDIVYNEGINEKESFERMLQMGGDTGSDRVADIVQHIVDMKYTNV